jgi:fatty-acyl-CoA synthase
VPTIWLGLLQVLKARPDLDLSSLTRLVCGGSAAPRSLIEALDSYGLPMLHAWGMTETSPIGTVANVKAGLTDLTTEEQLNYRVKQGYPVPLVDLRIADLVTGDELPWDGVTFGEIQVRGPWVTGNYYHDANPSVDKFVDGWFRTGDVATIDPEGYIEIVDRTKDVIKSGGEWISSVQLEGIIMGHPQVLEAAVIGLPHPKWQERPIAIVMPKPDAEGQLTPEIITAYLQDKVARWWLPDQILIGTPIPKTSVGKFDKKLLRSQLAEQVHLGTDPE